MKKGLISFVAGMSLGVLVGALIGEEEKAKIRKILSKQAGRLRKEYERPIRDVAAKIGRLVKDHLYQ